MPHALTEHSLPGLDAHRLKQLAAAGLASLEDVVGVGPERLATLTGFDRKTCRALVRVAGAALDRQDPSVIPFQPIEGDEPGSIRLARGLETARRIEDAVSMVRTARSHAGKVPLKAGWARSHRRARSQLRKLLASLESLQRSVLSDGVSAIARAHLEAELDGLAAGLRPLLDAPIRKPSLKQLRRMARATRDALEQRAPR
ncbi:MAG: helix-hairpin-helix domain-containing protein [Myxococcota bacterium]